MDWPLVTRDMVMPFAKVKPPFLITSLSSMLLSVLDLLSLSRYLSSLVNSFSVVLIEFKRFGSLALTHDLQTFLLKKQRDMLDLYRRDEPANENRIEYCGLKLRAWTA
jgi:hypothetical protein